MKLSKVKTNKFNKILNNSSIDKEIRRMSLKGKEKDELKAFAIKNAIKLKRYVRN